MITNKSRHLWACLTLASACQQRIQPNHQESEGMELKLLAKARWIWKVCEAVLKKTCTVATNNACKVLLKRLVTWEPVHSQGHSPRLGRAKIMTKSWHMGHISTILLFSSKNGSKSIRAKDQLKELQLFFQSTTPKVRTIWWQERVDLCRFSLQMPSAVKTLHQLLAGHPLIVWNLPEVLAVGAEGTMAKEDVAIAPHEASREAPPGPRARKANDSFRGSKLSDRI